MGKLVGQNITASVRFGGPQDGTPNFSGTPTSIKCLIKTIRERVAVKKVDQTGLCDTSDKTLITRITGMYDIEAYVDATRYFRANVGNYCEFTFAESAGATPVAYVGVIEDYDFSIAMDENQVEKFALNLGVV